MPISLVEWMPARLWRIDDLRGHDLNYWFFDSLDRNFSNEADFHEL